VIVPWLIGEIGEHLRWSRLAQRFVVAEH